MEQPISKTLIRDQWQILRGELPSRFPSQRLEDARNGFYLGAAFMFNHLMEVAGSGRSDAEKSQLCRAINDELEDFAMTEGCPDGPLQ